MNTMHEELERLRVDTPEVTYRSWKQYCRIFSLSEEILQGRKILDLAAGLSNFTEEVNKRYGQTGTEAYALDIAYAVLREMGDDVDYDSFMEAIQERTVGGLGAGYYLGDRNKIDSEERHNRLTVRLRALRLKLQDPHFLAESALTIPLEATSVDLILVSNFLLHSLQVKDPRGKEAFLEAGRVIREDGEMRVWPLWNFRRIEPGEDNSDTAERIVLVDNVTVDEEDNLVLIPSPENVTALQDLEKAGFTFYFVTTKSEDIMVVKKNSESPNIDGFINESLVSIKKLQLSHYQGENCNVPYEEIYRR